MGGCRCYSLGLLSRPKWRERLNRPLELEYEALQGLTGLSMLVIPEFHNPDYFLMVRDLDLRVTGLMSKEDFEYGDTIDGSEWYQFGEMFIVSNEVLYVLKKRMGLKP